MFTKMYNNFQEDLMNKVNETLEKNTKEFNESINKTINSVESNRPTTEEIKMMLELVRDGVYSSMSEARKSFGY